MQIIKLEDHKVNSTIIMSLKNAKLEDFLNLSSTPEIFFRKKKNKALLNYLTFSAQFCSDKTL